MARFLVVLDVDSTLIEDEVIELLAEEAGSLEQVAKITFRAMNGELDFEESLRERVATLRGVPVAALARVQAQEQWGGRGLEDTREKVYEQGRG